MLLESSATVIDPQARSLNLRELCGDSLYATNWITLDNGYQSCTVSMAIVFAQGSRGVLQKFNNLGLTKEDGSPFKVLSDEELQRQIIQTCTII